MVWRHSTTMSNHKRDNARIMGIRVFPKRFEHRASTHCRKINLYSDKLMAKWQPGQNTIRSAINTVATLKIIVISAKYCHGIWLTVVFISGSKTLTLIERIAQSEIVGISTTSLNINTLGSLCWWHFGETCRMMNGR